MIDRRGNKRIVSICLRDFSYDPELVRLFLGSEHIDVAKKGDRVGKNSIIRKNLIAVWEPTYALENWDEPIRRLVTRLGGFERIKQLIGFVNAKHAWLQVDVPAKGSPYVETNRICSSLMRDIGSAGLSFGVEVFAFDSGEPTHHPLSTAKKRIRGQVRQKTDKE